MLCQCVCQASVGVVRAAAGQLAKACRGQPWQLPEEVAWGWGQALTGARLGGCCMC